jgi:hypothetical protein
MAAPGHRGGELRSLEEKPFGRLLFRSSPAKQPLDGLSSSGLFAKPSRGCFAGKAYEGLHARREPTIKTKMYN